MIILQNIGLALMVMGKTIGKAVLGILALFGFLYVVNFYTWYVLGALGLLVVIVWFSITLEVVVKDQEMKRLNKRVPTVRYVDPQLCFDFMRDDNGY